MKNFMISRLAFCLVLLSFSAFLSAQNNQAAKDSTAVKTNDQNVKSDRNVMLNASDNSSPRDVNIGLPSTVGGITILEDDLPVVYYFWPELPNRSWRQSVSLKQSGLMKMDQVVGTLGDLGFAVNSYSQTGTKDLKIKAKLTANHFGLFQSDLSVSGPISKNGWAYSIGAFINMDPGTAKLGFDGFADQTNIFRVGITKFWDKNKGQISLQYKYSDSYSISNYAIFEYGEGGIAKETDFFKIGSNSYLVNDGTARFKDLSTGEFYSGKVNGETATTTAHNVSVFGNYLFDNGWDFKFSTRFHASKASVFSLIPTGIKSVEASAGYTYMDGTPFSGYLGNILAQSSPKNPQTDLAARFSMSKKLNNHFLTIGLLEQFHSAYYSSNRAFYYQTVEDQPSRLMGPNTDQYGYYNYNNGAAYNDGYENRIALYASDNWDITRNLNLQFGVHLRSHSIRGTYSLTPRTPGFDLNNAELTDIKDDLFHLAGYVNIKYNITKDVGVLGNFQYNETNGGLENYNLAMVPSMQKSRSPLGAVGVFWNNKYVQLVSQATILYKNSYLKRFNLVNPNNSSEIENASVYYDIQTIGWTTDVMLKPFKGFNLHFLLTLQDPLYKNFKFNAFGQDYDYSNKSVLEISKVLIEIDPSYTFGKNDEWRIWASFRYFSKQYANLTNVLYFAPRWETFGGVNYKLNKNFNLGVSVVNFLNQRGAKGSINGAELITDPTPYYGKLMTGSYIMPFTVQFTTNISF